MKDLIIVGAGGFGREAYYLAKSLGEYNIKGFIDDKEIDMAQKKIYDTKWIGTIKDWQPSENEVFAMGIASPKAKEAVANILKSKGAKFETMIGSKVNVHPTAEVGEGCIITSGSIGDCAKLGSFVHIAGSHVGQESEIGNYTTSTLYVNTVTSKIGKRCFIGSQSVLLADIGNDVKVCAGSIVFRKVKDGLTVMGNPAKKTEF